MADVDEIVVTGRRTVDTYSDTWFYRDWMSSGFDNYFTSRPSDAGGQGGSAAISDVVQTDVANYEIPATDDMPKIVLNGVTQKQYDEFMAFYSNMKHDPELKAEFLVLAGNNNVVRLTMSDTLPPNADPTALATITFREIGDLQGENQFVMPNTTIDIIVKGKALTENGSWDTTFKGVLAHELTHLKKDADGRYLDDHYNENYSGETTRSKDQQTYNNLTSKFAGENYSSSLEISLSIDPIFNQATFFGTDGNNHIEMGRGLTNQSLATALTGAGNDLIIGSDTNFRNVYVNGSGRKAVALSGTSYDEIMIAGMGNISELAITYVGGDAYLTSSNSAFSPTNDPNAIVVLGMTQGSRTNAVDRIVASDFSYVELHPYVWSRSAPDASADFAAPAEYVEMAAHYGYGQNASPVWDYL